MRPILPPWTDSDPVLHARLGAAIDPDRKVLGALERIVPLSGKRIADVGTGIGHYPMLLARRMGRTYGVESDPTLLAEARRRASDSHQPNIRIVEGVPIVIVRDGVPVDAALQMERIPFAEVLEAARQNGVEDLAEIRLAVLEVNGRISVIKA